MTARRTAGQGNNAPIETSRTYLDILRDNLFTFINGVFVLISLVLIWLGLYGDMLVIVGIISSNVLVNLVQEMRAKRTLDQIALLTRPKATVIRQGETQAIDPSEIVRGDILLLRPGDQIVVDGQVVGSGNMEVDEALLTGESDLITKQAGDFLYSGSYCVSGSAYYEAQKVGAESLAHQITSDAKLFRQVSTPLQHEINLIMRVLLLIAIFLWFLTGAAYLINLISLEESVQRAAVIAGLVPAGLYLMTTLAYALGAVRIVGKNALIQQANAVESLSNVDILCLDKTGTLTTNRLKLEAVQSFGLSESDLKALLGDYARSLSGGNRTTEALAEACPGEVRLLSQELLFSSSRKWSGLAFDDPAWPGAYCLGAPEMLAQRLTLSEAAHQQMQTWAEAGWRVLAVAHSPAGFPSKTAPELPTDLTLVGLISFSDELRPQVRATLQQFQAAGIQPKIISGDNPHTVAALAKQAGFGPDIQFISGPELAILDEAQFIQTAEKSFIFGRITPQQKAELVQRLRQQGHYVAMIGDGVNDVLSLKQANLGIAMESGSQITRHVADIVLLRDSFEALPYAFQEGQRIRNGVQDVMKCFMVRIVEVTLLIFAAGMVTATFPLLIKHNSLVALLTVGLPTFGFTLWAKSGITPAKSMVRSLLHFVLPAAFSLAVVGLTVYLGFLMAAVMPGHPIDPQASVGDMIQQCLPVARTALVTVLVLCGSLLLPFLKPPTPAWVGGAPLSGDWRHSYVALGMVSIYGLITVMPPLRNFFDLRLLSLSDYVLLAGIAGLWGLTLRYIWRAKLFDHFLGVPLSQYADSFGRTAFSPPGRTD